MSRRDFSCWFNTFSAHKRTKTSQTTARADRHAGRRVLRVERLEDRRLLSTVPTFIGPLATAAASPAASQPAAVASPSPGPTIGQVVTSATQGVLTWNAGPGPVESSGLTVDGVAMTDVQGPYTADSGANYAWSFGSTAPGTHTYVITATDGDGNATQYDGTFNVGANLGPTIHQVVVSLEQNVITWNVAAASGVASSSLTVDGGAVKNLCGPYQAPPGVDYAGTLGTLSNGIHTYVISAVDGNGQSWQYSGTFAVGDASPFIGQVVVSATQGVITWNAAAASGVASTSLTIDGGAVQNLCGPYEAPPGVNYAGVFGPLASGGHTYVITATDGAGHVSQSVGVFAVKGPAINQVVVSAAQGVITWNAAAASGVAGSSLTIDGTTVTNLCGPYQAPPGVNYAGVFGPLSSGPHTYVITATDGFGCVSKLSGTFNVAGPKISQVVISATQSAITWNVAAEYGVATSGLTVDGVAVANLSGPFTAPPGVNYSGSLAGIAAGSHTYAIKATDGAGNTTQYTGTFVVGPTIGQVVVSETQGVISWNVAAALGVASSALSIDGAAVTNLSGPYTAPPGVNYSGSMGKLSSGSHTYAITATDGAGNVSRYTGVFVVGPTISKVVVSAASAAITWNVAAALGVVGTTLTIDGSAVMAIDGPYTAPPGVNYAASYGILAGGNHSYLITAIDGAGNSTQYSGIFAVG
jgi:large repetitive protein